MGCQMSKPVGEPRTIIIKLPGSCSKISRSYSSPTHLADGGHVSKNPNSESFHAVSLTSSTYGSLRLDSLLDYGGVRSRRSSDDSLGDVTYEGIRNSVKLPVDEGSYSWARETDPSLSASGRTRNIENVKPSKGANTKQVEIVNMWELMDGIEDEKAALKMLRGLVERPRVSGHDSGHSTPRTSSTIHTIEDVDNVLNSRGSLLIDYPFRRGSSLESVVPVRQSLESGLTSDKMIGKSSAMLLKRRARAMKISQEVIEELDDLRRRNLSRRREFNVTGRRDISRSQEFTSTGRDVVRSQEFDTIGKRNMSRSQEFNAAGRRNLSLSQDFDSIGRYKHIRSPDLDPIRRGARSMVPSRNQEHDSKITSNVVRSQEFSRPPVYKPKGVAATRHSMHEIPRTVQLKDESKVSMSKPDVVLRSPLLRGVRGHERQRARPGQESSKLKPASAINIESTNELVSRSHAQPTPERNSTLPKGSGEIMANLDLNSS